MLTQEEEILAAIELTADSIRVNTRLIAAGAPVPEYFRATVAGLCAAGLEAHAVTDTATPREVAENYFKAAINNADWPQRLARLAELGRRRVGEGDEGLTAAA